MIKMVVFLGNYGNQYRNTRHNVGWLFEEYLNRSTQKMTKFKAEYYKESNIVYLLPQTLMNRSGESVVKAISFFKINIDEVLVVHDDLETEFGSIKIKHGGGLAGHNGLRSIKDLTGSSNFKRLAIGISRPSRGSVANYVLERFTPQEESELEIIFKETENYFTKFLGDNDETKGKKVVILQEGRGKR